MWFLDIATQMCLVTSAVGLKEQLGETKAISEKFVRRTIPKTEGSLPRLHIRVPWELIKILLNNICRNKF